MPLTENKIPHFLEWWQQGLTKPLPIARAEPVVLQIDGDNLCDLSGQKLSDKQLKNLRESEGVYLLAPQHKVISKRISSSQKGLLLQLIAEQVMPFDASELVLACDGAKQNIHAIVKADMAHQFRVTAASGLDVIGVAFTDGTDVLLSSDFNAGNVGNIDLSPSKRRALLVWLSIIVITLSAPLAGFAYMSHCEILRADTLRDELGHLQAELEVSQARSISALPTPTKGRDAANVTASLKSLTNALSEQARVVYLILSADQLVIDANAKSATQIQANVDASGAFVASEFVTTISRSASDDTERFRLRISLRGAH